MRYSCFVLIFSFVLIFKTSAVFAETGVTETKIIFGQTAVTGGPAQKLGKGMEAGLRAAFREANDAGGIAGRKLELVTLDDGYEPDRAVHNVRMLIESDKVFAVAGGVGTPTSLAVEPILTAQKIPYIAPFSGAEFLRHPHKKYVLNVRASYYEEAEKIAELLVDIKGFKKVAVLYQDDSFGRTALEGLHQAFKSREITLVAEAAYKRNTTAVKRAVLEIKAAEPEAVVMIGTYQPLASFIRLCRELGMKAEFVSLSFVSSEALAADLGAEGEGVIITQVVPYPFSATTKIAGAYRTALKRSDPDAEYGYVSFEGYIAGRFIVETLKLLGRDVTREKFLQVIIDNPRMSLDDLALEFGQGDNQALHHIYTTVIDNKGKIQPYEPPRKRTK